jgi:hypothetical protein
MSLVVSLKHVSMRSDVCFDAATERATGGRQTSIPPILCSKVKGRDTPKDTPALEGDTGVLLAGLCPKEFRPHMLHIALRESVWIVPGLEHRLLSVLARIHVDEVGIFGCPVERLETCTPTWKTIRPVLPCLADRGWLPKSATSQSLKLVCGVFCELRLDGVLGSCPSSPTGGRRGEKDMASCFRRPPSPCAARKERE